MPHKQVLFRDVARAKILAGATQLADAVRITLGPRSKSVLIEKKWGTPIVCNDGVTIAKEFDLKDPEENLGARMLRAAAEKTGEMVGDGTSTATILAHAIFADGLRNVVAGASAVDIKRGLDKALACAVAALKGLSRPVSTSLEKQQIAAISAHNDEAIGLLVAEAMEKVGEDGVITVEEAKTTETHLDVVEGMQLIVASSLPISAPTLKRWKWCWRMSGCWSSTRRSPRSMTWSVCLRRWQSRAVRFC